MLLLNTGWNKMSQHCYNTGPKKIKKEGSSINHVGKLDRS